MKVKIMNMIAKIMSCTAALALMVAVSNANNTCLFWSYQPDMPEELMTDVQLA